MQNRKNDRNDFVVVGSRIKAKKVLCINGEENLGVMDTYKALELAKNLELDLVQVSATSKSGYPICKITDYGKYKYELSKKKKEQAKKQRESAIKTKEIKFRPVTDINDLVTKANKTSEFLSDGCRVKIIVSFKGRELNYKEIAFDTLNIFLDMVENYEMLENPSINGKSLVAMIKYSQKTLKAS